MKYVIGLGGSILCPEEINISYLKRFKKFIEKESINNKFVIIVGGGSVARKYQKAAKKFNVSSEKLDWLGILATKLNAELLKSSLVNVNPILFDERFKVKSFKYPLTVGSGWKPGWSTDYVAVQVAKDMNVDNILFLGKPEYVYTSDFSKDKSAKPIKEISWKEYFKIIPSKWEPGLCSPVDPVAARLAYKNKISLVVAGGRDLKNVKKILDKKPFKGTTLYA